MNKTKKVLIQIMSQKHNYSPDNMHSPKSQNTSTAVPDNKKSPPLKGGNSKNIYGMWTLKHDIRSPKFYELFIKTEL